MAKKIGKDAAVYRGASKIVGMGNWKLSGITAEEVELTEFRDNWKSFDYGVKDGGTLTFSGLSDAADAAQHGLQQANLENTDVTNLRFYIDNTSYYEPCQTTGYFSPSLTTGASTVLSHVNVTTYNIEADKSGAERIDFAAKVSGVMVLV